MNLSLVLRIPIPSNLGMWLSCNSYESIALPTRMEMELTDTVTTLSFMLGPYHIIKALLA